MGHHTSTVSFCQELLVETSSFQVAFSAFSQILFITRTKDLPSGERMCLGRWVRFLLERPEDLTSEFRPINDYRMEWRQLTPASSVYVIRCVHVCRLANCPLEGGFRRNFVCASLAVIDSDLFR